LNPLLGHGKIPKYLPGLTLAFLFWLGSVAQAPTKDLSMYRLGDVLEDDVVAPADMAVPDLTATAALKSSEALKVSAVFRDDPGITNALASQFTVAFDTAHSDFLAALQQTFQTTVLDHATVMSPDFGYFLTAYNFDHPKLPLPFYLAMDWAYGKDGALEKVLWLNKICSLMQNRIRPDNLPVGFELGDSVQLAPVRRPNEVLTPGDVATRARTFPSMALVSLSDTQIQLRREFAKADEQILARALSTWLQPNCLPEAALTQEVRDAAVRRLAVAECYSAGQLIAPKGSVVGPKLMAVLDRLTQKQRDTAAIPAREWHEAEVPLPVDQLVSLDQFVIPDPGPPVPTAMPSELAGYSPVDVLFVAGAFAVAAIIIRVSRQIFSRQNRAPSLAVVPREFGLSQEPGLQTDLAPQILQVVRQAFIHELSGQRRDLLMAQQIAASEVVTLVQRMDALQVAMQDRLRAYEAKIQQLEADLIARKEENRQLIRLKIQMLRHQVDLETTPQRAELN
jgi:hypothetical protein